MLITTRRDKIKGVLKMWLYQYPNAKTSGCWYSVIYAKLTKLDLGVVDRGIVDKVIGNKSWTSLICDGCGKDVESVIWFGGIHEHSDCVGICKECATSKIDLIKSL